MQTDGTPDSMRPPSVARQNRHINVTYFRTFYRFAFDAAPILLEVLLQTATTALLLITTQTSRAGPAYGCVCVC